MKLNYEELDLGEFLLDRLSKRKEARMRNYSVTLDGPRVDELYERIAKTYPGFDRLDNSKKVDYLIFAFSKILDQLSNSPSENNETEITDMKMAIWRDFEALEAEGIPHARYMSNSVRLMREKYNLEYKDE